MFNSRKASIAEKITDIIASSGSGPTEDIKEDYIDLDTQAKCVAHFDVDDDEIDITSSQYRRKNIQFLSDVDERYSGKKSSRKHLFLYSLSSSSEQEEGVRSIVESQEFVENDLTEKEKEETYSTDISEGNDEEASVTAAISNDVVEKGASVRNQIQMWEKLLEMRIQMQQLLIGANRMPRDNVYHSLKMNDPEYNMQLKTTRKTIAGLLNKLLTLQTLTWKQFPETVNLPKTDKNTAAKDEIPSDSSVEEEQFSEPKKCKNVSEFSGQLAKRFVQYTCYRNSVIQKWNEKTTVDLKQSKVDQQSIVQQISYVLNSDKERLRKRTRIARSEYSVIGRQKSSLYSDNEEQIEDVEIFDDGDFYHQLLRELIETKSSSCMNPIQLGQQWVQLQQLRNKRKRSIDTRATKGRKIRYTVHSKLVNFMAPISTNSLWTDEAKSELYNSLFGAKSIRSWRI